MQQVEVTGRVVQQELRNQRCILQKDLQALAMKLSAAVKLNIATTRTLDRYRTALERSVERELGLLANLRAQRAGARVDHGAVPQVELKVVR